MSRYSLAGNCCQDSERALLRFVRVTGVHLLEVDRPVLDEEPDAGGAVERRLVLPALVGLVTAGDRTEITAQREYDRIEYGGLPVKVCVFHCWTICFDYQESPHLHD